VHGASYQREAPYLKASCVRARSPLLLREFVDPIGVVASPDGRFPGHVTPCTSFGSASHFREDVIRGTDADSMGVTYVVRGRVVRP